MADKRAIIQAVNRVHLGPENQTALGLNLIIDILIQGNEVVIWLADRVGGPEGTPVPPEWVERIQKAVATLPDVSAVRIERKPTGTLPPSLQRTQKGRPTVDLGATKVIAVASGKGGVGKSTVTANLAMALSERGQRVGAVDADIYGFSLPALLGGSISPGVTPDKRLVPAELNGVRLLSMDSFIRGNQPVIWRGPMLGKMLLEFVGTAVWDGVDVLLLDLPPGTGDIALDVHEMLPESAELIVTTPDPLAARVAERAGHMASQTGHSILGVVENMSYLRCSHCDELQYPFGSGGGQTAADVLGVPLLASIPLGSPVVPQTGIFTRESEVGQIFAHLAEEVLMRYTRPERAAIQ